MRYTVLYSLKYWQLAKESNDKNFVIEPTYYIIIKVIHF